MTEDSLSSPSERPGVSRRGFLALVGAGSIAGCQDLGGLSKGDESTIRVVDLPDIDEDSISEPVVAPSIPVAIAPSYLAEQRSRVSTLLAQLPTPLGPAAIPNGHVRERLTDAADEATDALDAALTARTDRQAVESLRRARGEARYAAAGWAFTEGEASVESLEGEHEATLTNAAEFRDQREYVGDDPVRAALVHAPIETAIGRVIEDRRPYVPAEGALLTVADWGETAEQAQATLDDARHFQSQFSAALPEDVGTVAGVLEDAASSLLADLEDRRSTLPPEPTAEDWGVAERLVADLRQNVEDGPETVDAARGPASAVLDVTEAIAADRALDRVQDRIDAGEVGSVESGEQLRRMRSTAYETLETALTESPSQGLARTVLTDVSWHVSSADREIDRVDRNVPPARLDDAVESYLYVTAMARATPPACRQTVDALESA